MADKTEAAVAANTTDANIALTDAEKAKAQKEGAKQDVQETAKDAHHALTDGIQLGDPAPGDKYHGWDEIQMWAYILDLGVDEFEARISDKGDNAIPDAKVYGLLALERNGKNRTPYVKACMKRLKLKSDELPGGGPDYTNDISNLSKL